MSTDSLIPAAQYLRMSTEHQQYSLDNQAATIQRYAASHRFEIVRTYSDAAKSGVVLRHRDALKQLLRDVVGGNQDYRAILVYDVSRWGRFQDADEAAHYEFLCKQAGIPVHYCAEPFSNDGTLSSTLLKALKRSMAAEYSRELGVKCYEGQKRLAEMGYRVGGTAIFGYRRMMVSADGKRERLLKKYEYKHLHTDRVILVPGPKKEIETVREMFTLALRMDCHAVWEELRARGLKYLDGKPWSYATVHKTLKNPTYAGWNVWGRTSQKFHSPTRTIRDRGQWVKCPNAFKPLVDPDLYERVQTAIRKRREGIPDKRLLSDLKKLLKRKGKLTERMIMRESPHSYTTYVRHFGNVGHAFDLIGYRPKGRAFTTSEHWGRTVAARNRILTRLEARFPGRVRRFATSPNGHSMLLLDNRITVSVLACRYLRTPFHKYIRWELLPHKKQKASLTLVCLMNSHNSGATSYYLFSDVEHKYAYQIRGDKDPWLKNGKRLKDLRHFCTAANELMTRIGIKPFAPPGGPEWTPMRSKQRRDAVRESARSLRGTKPCALWEFGGLQSPQ